MAFVTTSDNVKLYVKEWGAGRPVVMIHGWPLSCDTFDDLSIALAEQGMRAISYDRRGFGRSDQPWEGYDYNTLADDLAAVLEQTHARDAVLLGFSMGGGEVARYMSRHHGLNVSKAILVASIVPYLLQTPDHREGVPLEILESIGNAIKEDRAKFFAGFFKDFYGVGTSSTPVSAEVIEWSRTVAMSASLKATLACAEAFGTTDFRSELSSFKAPTLIIHGTADKIVPIDATARKAAVGIEGSSLIEYDGAPHGLLASHKGRLVEDVLRFLSS